MFKLMSFLLTEAAGGGTSDKVQTTTTEAGTLKGIAKIFAGLMEKVAAPILIVLGAAAAAYAVYLGVMYAKAEDGNKRKEVQGRLIGAAVGLVIILVGVALCFAVDWAGLATEWSGMVSKTS